MLIEVLQLLIKNVDRKKTIVGASKTIRQRYENDASITLPTSQQPVDWTVG